MPNGNAVVILGITATADEWTAWSAIGTVGATLIAVLALTIPLVAAWTRRRATKMEDDRRYMDILSGVIGSLKNLEKAKEAYYAKDFDAFMAAGAQAAYKTKTLMLIAGQGRLPAGITATAIGAVEVGEETKRASEMYARYGADEAFKVLGSAYHTARSVRQRLGKIDPKMAKRIAGLIPDISWPDR